MKALSIRQPWATLVVIGAKQIETRSWYTHYRGPLLIHASKGFPLRARQLCLTEPFQRTLSQKGFGVIKTLPLGAVIGKVTVFDCKCIPPNMIPPGMEKFWGDFSPGRYAWLLDSNEMLPTLIPYRGQLGLFEVEDAIAGRLEV